MYAAYGFRNSSLSMILYIFFITGTAAPPFHAFLNFSSANKQRQVTCSTRSRVSTGTNPSRTSCVLSVPQGSLGLTSSRCACRYFHKDDASSRSLAGICTTGTPPWLYRRRHRRIAPDLVALAFGGSTGVNKTVEVPLSL